MPHTIVNSSDAAHHYVTWHTLKIHCEHPPAYQSQTKYRFLASWSTYNINKVRLRNKSVRMRSLI